MNSPATISSLPEMPFLGFGTRLFLLLIGLFSILVPAWELRHAFIEIGWWTLFCGIILVGAWGVGLVFVTCAVASGSTTWSVEGSRILVRQHSPLGTRSLVVEKPDIARTEIRTDIWSDGPDSFSVIVHLRSGEQLHSAGLETRFAAERLEKTLRSRLGMA